MPAPASDDNSTPVASTSSTDEESKSTQAPVLADVPASDAPEQSAPVEISHEQKTPASASDDEVNEEEYDKVEVEPLEDSSKAEVKQSSPISDAALPSVDGTAPAESEADPVQVHDESKPTEDRDLPDLGDVAPLAVDSSQDAKSASALSTTGCASSEMVSSTCSVSPAQKRSYASVVASGSPKLESLNSKEECAGTPALRRSSPVLAARSAVAMSDSSLPANSQEQKKMTRSELKETPSSGLCQLFSHEEPTKFDDYAEGFHMLFDQGEARAALKISHKQRRQQKKRLSKSAPVVSSTENDGFENLRPLIEMDPQCSKELARATQAAVLTLASSSKLGSLQGWSSVSAAVSVVAPSETEQTSDPEQEDLSRNGKSGVFNVKKRQRRAQRRGKGKSH